MNTLSTTVPRRYELDWLRALAILAIFVYHCALIFAPDPFSIKNSITYQFIDDVSDFAAIWGLPLIFIISGASVFYALGKVGPGKYLKGIAVRLLVPLTIGTFTHIAFQVYLERLHKGEFSGSFFDFYPHYFVGMYGFGGNFAWMGLHLWYLEALFLFALLCLPLFVWLKKSGSGQRVLQGLGDFLAKPGGAFLLALPPTVLFNLLDPNGWGTTVLGGWSIFIYLSFFLSGFVIVSNERLQASIKSWRWISLTAGVLLAPAIGIIWDALGDPVFGTPGFVVGTALFCLSAWCWLLAIFGFGFQHLNRNKPFLRYANEAVLPFYILHQTVVLSLAFFVVRWAVPDLVKFLSILSASFLIVMVLYEFLVRRINVLRFLFGMKVLPRRAAVPVSESQVMAR